MNREQRRAYVKKMRRVGMSKSDALENLEKMSNLSSGDKVRIDYDKIMKRKSSLSDKYIEFITENKDKIFTLKKTEDVGAFYTFEEIDETENPWMFSPLDVIKVEDLDV